MKVILAAGGSGGHIFPSIALADELKKRENSDIFFVSSKRRLDKNIFKGSKYPCFFLSINPMPLTFNVVKIIGFILKFFKDMVWSFYIILKVKPDVVVGFGGYSSGTICVAAKVFRVPILLHEQNYVPGRANKILCRIADSVALSFDGTDKYFANVKTKIVHSGNPLRIDALLNDRDVSAKKLGLFLDRKTVLIMGGSQGCSFLNETVSRTAVIMNKKMPQKLQFIHLTGPKDYARIKQFYEENAVSGKVFSFLETISDAYAASDLAVTRSGAAAVFELAYYSRAMILVPYPNPKNNQRSNARYFADKKAAVYKEEGTFSAENLAEEIYAILFDEKKLYELSQSAGRLACPSAGKNLAEEVFSLAVKNR
ncbi:MAG: undecaprenyldiphospho-muramoylpentapeptide beta-N-acetylglucosaminyltransferase [Candidatus Omnitrophota bacterium]